MLVDGKMLTQTVNLGNPLNKGFLLLHELFTKNSWVCIKNELTRLTYTKVGYETSIFDLRVDESRIYVSIPVKNSPYQYCTSFTDYFNACEYIEERFKDYINDN